MDESKLASMAEDIGYIKAKIDEIATVKTDVENLKKVQARHGYILTYAMAVCTTIGAVLATVYNCIKDFFR